eukprot:CFRG4566T1
MDVKESVDVKKNADVVVNGMKKDDEADQKSEDWVMVNKPDMVDESSNGIQPDVKQGASVDDAAASDKESDQQGADIDEEEDIDVPLFNADPIIHGKRQRKSVERMTSDTVKPKTQLKILQGKGTKLGDMEAIEAQLKKREVSELKELHRMMFGTAGAHLEVRKHIRQFNGFDYESNTALREKHTEWLEKKFKSAIKNMCDVLCLRVSGDKEAMIESLLTFLDKPNASEVHTAPKKKSKASKKTMKKKKPKIEKVKRAPSAYAFFMKHNRNKMVEKYPGLKPTEYMSKVGELWKTLSNNEKKQYEDMSEDAKAKLSATPKKASMSKSKSKTVVESCEDDDDDNDDDEVNEVESEEASEESDEDQPVLKKAKKSGPSDAELKKTIKEIVKKAGDDVTFGQVRKGLAEKYPQFDINARKGDLKDMATTILQG